MNYTSMPNALFPRRTVNRIAVVLAFVISFVIAPTLRPACLIKIGNKRWRVFQVRTGTHST